MSRLHDWKLSDDARKKLREQLKKYEPIKTRAGSKDPGSGTKNQPSPPSGSDRACLCADGKNYSRDCCTGSYQAQGL